MTESLKLQHEAQQLLDEHTTKASLSETILLLQVTQLERRLTVAEADCVKLVWSRENHRKGDSPNCKAAWAAKARARVAARAFADGRITPAELEQRTKEQIRALKVPPAEPIIPYTDAEMALIASKRDKEAEAEYLQAVLADARDRSGVYQKYANPAQKADISLDKAG